MICPLSAFFSTLHPVKIMRSDSDRRTSPAFFSAATTWKYIGITLDGNSGEL